MATNQFRALKQKGNHEVGTLNSYTIRTVPHGAKAEVDIDNYTVVELGFSANGERTAKPLTDSTKKGYLIATPELLTMGENLVDFFNGKDEQARIVYFETGLTFETSAFTLNPGVSAIKNGLLAHFDVATKKFILSDASSAHLDYAAAHDKFTVVAEESNVHRWLGKPTVALEVQ